VPQTPHIEHHFASSEAVRDIVIGMSDGLTVPFALAAGLSGALESSSLIVVAGLAEVVAGAIAMGLGGYLAASSDTEHYVTERAREEREVRDIPSAEAAELTTVLTSYGLSAEESAPIVTALRKRPEAWVDFMMRFELGIERPNPRRAVRSALTIAGAYVAGGLIPLAPYIAIGRARIALALSVIVTSNCHQTFDRSVKGREQCLDLHLESRHRLFQVRNRSKMLAQQKPMMSSDLALQCRRQGLA
jgi:VIT1/CCC1 family predicted Fe2+/Mn2+ transporter